ncbi:MAG: plastocyanin/azurin family copper-binding protein [Actinomycetota bacterium]
MKSVRVLAAAPLAVALVTAGPAASSHAPTAPPTTEKGQSGLLRVALKKPGRYPFVCTVPGHIAAGMKGVLTVR